MVCLFRYCCAGNTATSVAETGASNEELNPSPKASNPGTTKVGGPQESNTTGTKSGLKVPNVGTGSRPKAQSISGASNKPKAPSTTTTTGASKASSKAQHISNSPYTVSDVGASQTTTKGVQEMTGLASDYVQKLTSRGLKELKDSVATNIPKEQFGKIFHYTALKHD